MPGARLLLISSAFQSTPPGWEATCSFDRCNAASSDFNPRLPGGRRRIISLSALQNHYFNPRLPGGRRRRADALAAKSVHFNPRLPGGRRPALHSSAARRKAEISIHASRVGGDIGLTGYAAYQIPFQSTPPGWEATYSPPNKSMTQAFQSTPPGWEATFLTTRLKGCKRFQSTPPGWEATSPVQAKHYTIDDFNPRLPGGRRRYKTFYLLLSLNFNPRLPGGRRLRQYRSCRA